MAKRLIQIDVSSEILCPRRFEGKKNLEKAIDVTRDQLNFEVHIFWD